MLEILNPLFDLKNFNKYSNDTLCLKGSKIIYENIKEYNDPHTLYESKYDYGFSKIYTKLLQNSDILEKISKSLESKERIVLYKLQKINKPDILNKLLKITNLSYIQNLNFSIDLNSIINNITKILTDIESYIHNIESDIYKNIPLDFLNYESDRLSYTYTYFIEGSTAKNNIKSVKIYLDNTYLISEIEYYNNKKKKYEIYFNPETTQILTILYDTNGFKHTIENYVNGVRDGANITYNNNCIESIIIYSKDLSQFEPNYLTLEKGYISRINIKNVQNICDIELDWDKFKKVEKLQYTTIIEKKFLTLILEWNSDSDLKSVSNYIFYTEIKTVNTIIYTTDYESENTLNLEYYSNKNIKSVVQYINNLLNNITYYNLDKTVKDFVLYKIE